MAPRTTSREYTRARKSFSDLQLERIRYGCGDYLPKVLKGQPAAVEKDAVPGSPDDWETIKSLFPQTCDAKLVEFVAGPEGGSADRKPLKVGVVLSGGQAPGGHNVIAGIFDGIMTYHEDSKMFGFLDGPHGIMNGNFVEITPQIMDGFRNTGGFDMLGSGRHKIETQEQIQDSMTVCNAIGLEGLVVIGGDDSNTNGAILAEHFKAAGCHTKVVGAPKTIDGDLKCPPYLPVSFGFDSACKTYATLVANVSVDALSAQKYYHLVRLMGRSASNIALEVALLTRPNACLLGEEVSRDKKSLQQLTTELADMIEERSKLGKDYGVIVLPEGLIEFIPEFNALIAEINDKLADPNVRPTEAAVLEVLSPENRASFSYLPDFIRAQLLLDRDPHGNVQVAKIETEKLLAATINQELRARKQKGTYTGTFSPQFHSYGYEGRAGMPTVFDAAYCYALGATAANLLANGCNGLIASVTNLLAPVAEWNCGGVPVTSLCVIERRHGKNKPVIRKALVELDGPLSQPYQAYCKIREMLKLQDGYRNPGPTQFDMHGCPAATEIPITLQLELGNQLDSLEPPAEPTRMGKFLYIPQSVATRSLIQKWRLSRKHHVPTALGDFDVRAIEIREADATISLESETEVLRKHFSSLNAPLLEFVASDAKLDVKSAKVGVVFCGRQAPGCHDLLCGMVDMMKRLEGSKVLGFVGGTKGMFDKQAIELTQEICEAYRGSGGLELLGRTVDRFKTTEELDNALRVCTEMDLTGLVLIGGARTNADAAYAAEYFKKKGSKTAIVAVPCGIEGSMVNEFVEASIGFDSSAKAMAQLVGNTAIDGASARKYYYFMKLMDGTSTGGHISSSHVALEVALQTKPNMLLLSEEVDRKRMSLREIVKQVADVVCARAVDGKNFGTIVVAEGLLGAIPEFRSLISELEAIPMPCPVEEALPQLTQWTRALFQSMPEFIQHQLLLERQSNAALSLSSLETECLIAWLVEDELKQRKKAGTYKGSFSAVCQYLGYQARCSMPSDFDMDYAYTMGGTAAILAANQKTGYMATVSSLAHDNLEWLPGGVPLTAMMRVPPSLPSDTVRPRPTIFPHQVDVEGPAFKSWTDVRAQCATDELYENPGPIQLSGPSARRVSCTITSKYSYVQELRALREQLGTVSNRCRPGCDPRTVSVAARSLRTLNAILDELLTRSS